MVDFRKLYPNGFNAIEIRNRSTSDPIPDFMNAMRAVGLEISSLTTTGELIRVKTPEDKGRKKTGWYVFHSSGEFSAGAFGDWRSGEQHTWSSHSIDEMDPEQRIRHKRYMDESRAEHERQKQSEYESAAIDANEIWLKSEHAIAENSEYLIRKQINPIGVRTNKNNVIVPITDSDGNLTSLQFIYGDGKKRFLTGGKIKGGRCPIGKITHTIYICEGYSTGATIHAATGDHVVCCMNAGNIQPVAEEIRQRHVSARIIIAGDNDQFLPEFTEAGQPLGNVGEKKATEVALKINAESIIPTFNDLSEEPTDFNDLMILEGIDAVKSQLGHIAPLSFAMATFAERELKQIQWVLDGVLSLGAPAILFAPGGAGKGYFIQQLTACVATGTPFFGTEVKQGPTLSIYCEDDIDELHRRQTSICEKHEIDYSSLDDVHIISRISEPNSFMITFDNRNIGTPTEFFHRIEAEIDRIRPVLVTFDTSGDAFPGNENDKAQVNQLLKGMVGALSSKYNCSFLLTGHTAKAENSQFAGHMSWENSVRHRIFIDHDRKTGIRRVHLSKSNRAKEGELYKLMWQDGCLVEMIDTGFVEGEIARALERDALILIQIFSDRCVNINMTKSRSYAPKMLEDLGSKKKMNWSLEQFEGIVERLLDEGVLELVEGHNRGKAQTLHIKITGDKSE